MQKNILTIDSISRKYRLNNENNFLAVDSLQFSVKENDFVCIVGPSGCGKSTLLRMIAGLENPTSGSISFFEEKIDKPNPDIGMVFQEYSLFPWLSVIDNVAAGLDFAGVKKRKRLETASYYLEIVGLSDFAESYPHELSGGMRQRVAIARAFATDPKLLLMDEPFGSLDAYTRILLQKELLRIWQTHQKTILFVTHSVDEAVFLADRVLIMSTRPGRIKEFLEIEMERPRSRANPLYGSLTHHILRQLEHTSTTPQNNKEEECVLPE